MKLVRTATIATLTTLLLSLNLSTPSWAQWGFTHLTMAKEAGQKPDGEDEAEALLKNALVGIEGALVDQLDEPMKLGNRGYALFLLVREDEAEAPLRRALELGGEKAFENTMEDAKIHPLPQDKAFVALVERLWTEVQVAQSDA